MSFLPLFTVKNRMNRFFNRNLRFPLVFQLATIAAGIYLVLLFFTHFVDDPRHQKILSEVFTNRSVSFVEDTAQVLSNEMLKAPGTFPASSFYQFARRPIVSDALVIDCSGEIYISKNPTQTGSSIFTSNRQLPSQGLSYGDVELYTQVAHTGVSIARELSNTERFYLEPLPCVQENQNGSAHAVFLLSFDWSEIVESEMAILNGITMNERLKWIVILTLIAFSAWLSIYPRVSRLSNAITTATNGDFKQAYNSQAFDELDHVGESFDNMVASFRQKLASVKGESLSLERGDAAFRYSDQAICILSSDQRVVDINTAYEKLTGHTRNEMIGRSLLSILPDNLISEDSSDLIGEDLLDNFEEETWSYKKNGARFRKSIRVVTQHDSNGVVKNYFCVERDVTYEHEQREKLELLAKTDPLTGIYNRRRFDAALKKLFREGQLNFAIGIINLDSMREINSEYGKGSGDAVIVESGRRLLLAVAGSNKSVFRFEGDEFYVLFLNIGSEHELERQARAVLSNLVGEISLSDVSVEITAGMGVALYDESVEKDTSVTLNQANLALRHAKRMGRSNVVLARDYVLSAERRKLSVSLALKSSRLTEQLRLSYLPRIDIQNGILAGANALVSWDFPQLGYVSKEEFLSIAEKTGDISRVDEWSINLALKNTAHFIKQISGFQTSIKISSQQFLKEAFSTDFLKQLRRLGIPSESIALELNEKSVLENKALALLSIDHLRAEGVSIHVQHVGLGYPLSDELRGLPLDALKVNQGLLGKQLDPDAIKTIISLASSMNVPVIVEGVESTYQLNLLKELGCAFCQGYLYSEPVSIDPGSDIQSILSDWQRSIEAVII